MGLAVYRLGAVASVILLSNFLAMFIVDRMQARTILSVMAVMILFVLGLVDLSRHQASRPSLVESP